MAALWTLVNGALKPRNAPAIVAYGRATAQVAANANVVTYTVGAADGSFEVSANVLITASTTFSFTAQCVYTDEGNTSRTLTFYWGIIAAGGVGNTIANAAGTVPYDAFVQHIRAKAGTTIVVSTVGSFTTVVYNVEGVIKQVN